MSGTDNGIPSGPISPDRRLLAYHLLGQIRVINALGQVIPSVPDPDLVLRPIAWANNETLLLSYDNPGPNRNLNSIVTIDLNTAVTRRYDPTFPEIDTSPVGILGHPLDHFRFMPSPTGRYTVYYADQDYPEFQDIPSTARPSSLVMWDNSPPARLAASFSFRI